MRTKKDAAFHEAAHAVVARDLRVRVKALVLEEERKYANIREFKDKAWKGHVVCPDDIPREERRRIAFAPYVASLNKAMKERARNRRVHFDDDSLRELTGQIVTWNPHDRKSEIGKSITLVIDGHRRIIPMNPDDIESDVRELYKSGITLDEHCVKNDLEWLRDWFATPANWQALQAIVSEVLRRQPEKLPDKHVSRRIRIEGPELAELIERTRG